jgi:hypothetical protein
MPEPVSVVVCTRDRSASLARLDPPAAKVVVG